MASRYRRKKGGNWYISYEFNGKRYYRSLKTFDEKLARLKQKELEVKLAKGLHAEVEQITIHSCFEEYLKTLGHRRKRTNDNELCVMKRFIEFAKRTSLPKVTTSDIFSFLKLYEKKTPVTYNNNLACIKRFMKFAIQRNFILKNPAETIKNKKVPQKEVTFFTDEQYCKIEKSAENHPLYSMIITARYTGLRLQELLSLEWQDFDWTKKLILVRNKKDHLIKNYRNRAVPICEEFKVKILPFVKREGLCFPVPSGFTKGQRYYEQGPKDTIQGIIKEAGVPVEKGKSWHKFRKTFATKLKDAGVSIAKISDWLGHGSIKVTELYLGCLTTYDEDIEKLAVKKENPTELAV